MMPPLPRLDNMHDYRATEVFTAEWFATGSYANGDDPYEGFDEEPVVVKVDNILQAAPEAWKGHEFEGRPFVVFFIRDRNLDNATFSAPPQVFAESTELVD